MSAAAPIRAAARGTGVGLLATGGIVLVHDLTAHADPALAVAAWAGAMGLAAATGVRHPWSGLGLVLAVLVVLPAAQDGQNYLNHYWIGPLSAWPAGIVAGLVIPRARRSRPGPPG